MVGAAARTRGWVSNQAGRVGRAREPKGSVSLGDDDSFGPGWTGRYASARTVARFPCQTGKENILG